MDPSKVVQLVFDLEGEEAVAVLLSLLAKWRLEGPGNTWLLDIYNACIVALKVRETGEADDTETEY